jgi:hypothetical protein
MKEKLKRFLTSLLPIAANRRGECNRCGQCCKLPFPCPFLRFDESGLSSCAVYFARPPSCRKYPRVESENLTPDTCGYYFVSADELRGKIRTGQAQPLHDAPNPAGAAAFEQQ